MKLKQKCNVKKCGKHCKQAKIFRKKKIKILK